MKKHLKSTYLFGLVLIIMASFHDCSNDEQAQPSMKNKVLKSSLLMDEDAALYQKISAIYATPSENDNATQVKKLFQPKDVLVEKSRLYNMQSGERVVKIPVAKHFSKNSGLTGLAYLVVREKQGIENAYFFSINYPIDANKNMQSDQDFTGTFKFYGIKNKQETSVGGFLFDHGKVTSILSSKASDLSNKRTSGFWSDFAGGVEEIWNDVVDWVTDCFYTIVDAAKAVVSDIGCVVAVEAAIDSAGIGTVATAITTCNNAVQADLTFIDDVQNSGCY